MTDWPPPWVCCHMQEEAQHSTARSLLLHDPACSTHRGTAALTPPSCPRAAGKKWAQPLSQVNASRMPLHRVFAKQRLDLMIAQAWMAGMPAAALEEVTKLSMSTGAWHGPSVLRQRHGCAGVP